MLLLTSCLSLALFAPVQDAAPDATAPAEARELGAVDYRGLDAFLVDEKDARLLAALSMIDDRLAELPGELGDMDAPPGVLPIVRRMIEGPMSLRVLAQDEAIAGMMVPLFGELRLTEGDADAADAFVLGTVEMLQMMGMQVEAPQAGALSVIPAPMPLWIGGEDADMVVRFGKDVAPGAPSGARYLPDGATTSCTMRFDYGAFLDTMMVVAEMSGDEDELAEMQQMFEMLGLQDLAIDYEFGHDDARSYEVVATRGYATMMRAMGMEPGGPLSPDRVAWIPEDASWATAVRMNFVGYLEWMNRMAAESQGQPDIDFIQMASDELGMDIRGDLLASLGEHMVMYGADSTGGGGLTSTVFVMELTQPAEFDEFVSQVVGMIAGLAAAETEGYLQFRRWNADGGEFLSLQTPGFPLPMEPTMTVVGDAAVFAVTPQGAVAAARQIRDPQRSIRDRRELVEQLPADMSTAMSLMFLDTPRFLRDGYGMTSLLCSAVANGVRSRDGKREPGLILPAFHDLAHGAKAVVGVGRFQGDTLVAEYRGDRSMLVNTAGLLGWMAEVPGPLLVPMAMGAAVGARESAGSQWTEAVRVDEIEVAEISDEEIQAWTDIDEIYRALDVYASANGGAYPANLDALARPDAQGNQYLAAVPLDPWGDPYRYAAPQGEGDVPYVWSSNLEDDYEEESAAEEVVEEPVIEDAETRDR